MARLMQSVSPSQAAAMKARVNRVRPEFDETAQVGPGHPVYRRSFA